MTHLSISLLGTFQVTRGNQPVVDFDSNKVRGLLAYLAVEADRPHTREALSALLWPDWPQDSALDSLRNALANLRRAIGDREAVPPHLLITRESIQFNTASDFWLDVAEFENANPRGLGNPWGLEAKLYRGPFLEGFSISDSAPFEEWLMLKREQLSQQALQMLRQLADDYEACGEYKLALEYARRQVALEPWLETAHRQVMRILALTGQRSQAMAQYETCQRLLKDELGLEPANETTRLYEVIKNDRLEEIRPGELLPAPGEPPYKGLQYFDVADAGLFFGRQALIERLAGHLHQLTDIAGDSPPAQMSPDLSVARMPILAVVGASGSGKSSLVRAGLVPALQSEGWQTAIMTPTAHPLEALAEASAKTDGQRLLVIDQFEELFTLCREEDERREFVEAITSPPAPSLRSGQARLRNGERSIVIVLRADFYGHCARFPRLRQALSAHQEYIGPMSAAELRQAIEEPARRNGWELEAGLVELILQDVGAARQQAPEPGALPLLEHALLETWKRRQGRRLTLQGYTAAGGVRSAIAHTAEGVFTQLSDEEQNLARRIFLRLTELGEGTQDTRRRAALSELALENTASGQVMGLLKQLSDARLITLTEDTAEVAHEALIREWPALRQWLSEDREGLRLHHRLSEAAQAWEKLQRDPGELYRGARLAQAAEWAAQHSGELNALELEFLKAAQEQANREVAEREAQRQRELEAAQRLAETEQRRAAEQAQAAISLRKRARQLVGVLGVVLVLLIAAIVLARLASNNANQANANAVQANREANQRATAEAVANEQRNKAENEAALAQARELAARSDAQLTYNLETSRSLALQAIEVVKSAGLEMPWAVQQAAHNNAIKNRLVWSRQGITGAFSPWAVAFTPDGKHVLYDNSSSVHVMDAATGEEQLTIPDASNHLAITPDGRFVVTAATPWVINVPEYGAGIWEIETGRKMATIPFDGWIPNVTPDGKWLAISNSPESTISLIDLSAWYAAGTPAGVTLTSTKQVRCPEGGEGEAMTVSPDSRLVTVDCYFPEKGNNQLITWEIESGKEVLHIDTGVGGGSPNYTPDGARLITSCYFKQACIWDAQTGQQLARLSGLDGPASTVVFSPDGKFFAIATRTPSIWDAASYTRLFDLPANGGVWECGFSADSHYLVTASQAGYVEMWDISTPGPGEIASAPSGTTWVSGRGFFGEGGYGINYMGALGSEDGSRWVETFPDGRVVVRESATLKELSRLEIYPQGPGFLYANFSHDNQYLAASRGGKLGVWELASGKNLFDHPAGEGWVLNLEFPPAFSPDGKLLAVGGYTSGVQVWDWVNSKLLMQMPISLNGLSAARFSPDGKLLAVGGALETYGAGGEVWVWDVSQPDVKPVKKYQITFDVRGVMFLDFSSDGQKLAVAGMASAGVIDMATGNVALVLAGHNTNIYEIHYRFDGKYLITAADDGKVKIWDPQTGAELLNYPMLTPGAFFMAYFTPDGKNILALGEDGYYHLYIFEPFDRLVELVKKRAGQQP